MKNIKIELYTQIRKDRESSYIFVTKASIEDLRKYNYVMVRNKPIFDQIRHSGGVYREINLIIKNEANIHAANH